MAEAALDDVFTDDITFPARDGYLLGATLFLPRGAKRHAVLINSATAVPRKIYQGFAGYLARRGCAVLTYDYRGTGDSRQKALVGYNQPKSLVGFKASMADWAALDVSAAVAWMRERYRTLPLGYIGHSFGGQALGLIPDNAEVSRALLIAAQAGYWKLMAAPERYRVYAMMNFIGTPLTRLLGYAPGWSGIGEDLPKDVFLQWTDWVMSKRYHVRRSQPRLLKEFCQLQGRDARAVSCPTIPGRRGRRSNCCARDIPRPSRKLSPSGPRTRAWPKSAISVSFVPNIATRCGGVRRNGSRRRNRWLRDLAACRRSCARRVEPCTRYPVASAGGAVRGRTS